MEITIYNETITLCKLTSKYALKNQGYYYQKEFKEVIKLVPKILIIRIKLNTKTFY